MELLRVKDLSKTYDKKAVVDNVCFTLHQNKCITLIGPNGAGKTTILRIISGLLQATTGTITFKNHITNDIRSIIGYLPQHPVFYSWMTGKEFLVYSGKLALLSKEEAQERAETLLQRVGISDAQNKRIGTYSGGMKQRLGIAQAIIHKPKLLILDEPVSALDPIGRRDVLTLMEELKEEMTILFSTHILSDADEISDELILLHQGVIIESGALNLLKSKYQTTNIEVGFESNMEFYQTKINQLPPVNSSLIQRNKLHINVANINKARQEILAMASNENWPVTSFTVNHSSLENMFLKAVNN